LVLADQPFCGYNILAPKMERVMATKKSAPAKKSTKKPAAKKTVKPAAKKKATRKPAKKKSSGGTLHNVARSIGSTLGSLAKKTTKAVEAAKDAIPGPLRGEF
jgi:hypothetical protein